VSAGKNWPAKHAKHAKNRDSEAPFSLRSLFTCGANPDCLMGPHFGPCFSMFSVFSGSLNDGV